MNRPSSPWSTGSVTDRFDDRTDLLDDEYDDDDVEDYDDYADYGEHDENDDIHYYVEHDDRRWMWVASVAGIVLLIAVAGTLMILCGGDSGIDVCDGLSPTSAAAPYPSAAPSPSAGRRPSATALPPETITSVTPTPTAAAPSTEPTEAAPPPAADPRDDHLHGDRQPSAVRPGHDHLHRPAGRAADRRQRRTAVDEDGGARPGCAAQLRHRDERRRSAQLLDHRRLRRHPGRRRPTTR